MASPEAKASSSTASVLKESGVLQVSNSNETVAKATSAAVTENDVEHSPLQPQQSSTGPSATPRAEPVAGVRPQWNLMQVMTDLSTEEDCIVFCEEQGLIPVTKKCIYHKRPMNLSTALSHGQLGIFRCHKNNCKMKPVSRAQGTWFENTHLALPIVFQMMYLFSHGASYEDVERETSTKTGPVVSTKTIADWYSYCRETILIYELENQIHETKIGGPNKIVVIEESKFGKRKYKKGKNMEGHLVLGIVGTGSDDVRLEVCPNKEKPEKVLVPLIQKHVAEGSIIRTSFWSGYDCLPEYGYIHEKFNHSDQDNQSAAPDETQGTENQWRKLRSQFQKCKCKWDFLDWLAEYSWRRKNKVYKRDPFEELLNTIKYVYGTY